PLGMAMLTFRFLQVTWQIATGRLDRLIAGHEAEEELEALKEEMSEAGDAMTPRSSNDSEHKER
ncbi:TRAP transporter small permease, partial [Vibrio sp. 506]|nr:TRAP transporter small permease [Vibrio sp. 506]